jgi:hypothetical protein
VDSTYYWNTTRLQLERCKEGRFNGMNDTAKQIGITDNYYCPSDDYNMTLKGSYSTKKANFFQIQIDYCTQDYLNWKFPDQQLSCKTRAEANMIISNI